MPRPYERRFTWPRSYGFPENTGTGRSPYRDCHALFLADDEYNGPAEQRSRRSTEVYAHFAPHALKRAADERARAMRAAVEESKHQFDA